MSKASLIILVSTLLLSIKLYPYFELSNLADLSKKKLESFKLPQILPFNTIENLKENDLLTKAVYIGHGQLYGPETIVRSRNGSLFTGLMNGQIARIDPRDNSCHRVTQVGAQTIESICNDFGPELKSKLECGRPLGLRIKPETDLLYIADSYMGIYKLDLNSGEKSVVISSVDPQFGEKPPKLVNDLDFDDDLVYFIDSSSERELNEVINEHIESMPNGRLFVFDETNNKLELLKEGLYLPNGLQFMPDKESILINENSRARILRFYVKGEKKGKTEVFLDNLPGFGDTIRLTDKNTLLVPFAAVRNSPQASFPDMLGEYPFVRLLISTLIKLRRFLTILPKYGLLVEYDLNGNVIKSWHDPTGKVVECTTSALLHENKLYLGSFYNDFIAVVDY